MEGIGKHLGAAASGYQAAEAVHKLVTDPGGFPEYLGSVLRGVPELADMFTESGARVADSFDPRVPLGGAGSVTKAYQGARDAVLNSASQPLRERTAKEAAEKDYLEPYRPEPFSARWFSDPTGEKAWQAAIQRRWEQEAPARELEARQRQQQGENEQRFRANQPSYDAEQNALIKQLQERAIRERPETVEPQVDESHPPQLPPEWTESRYFYQGRYNEYWKQGGRLDPQEWYQQIYEPQNFRKGSSKTPRRRILSEQFLEQYAA